MTTRFTTPTPNGLLPSRQMGEIARVDAIPEPLDIDAGKERIVAIGAKLIQTAKDVP